MNTNRLRGEIVAEFKTQAAFAKAITQEKFCKNA